MVMEDNGGRASLQTIYQRIAKYYKGAKAAEDWQAGIRGVLYREIRNGKTFFKAADGVYGIKGLEKKHCNCSLWAWTTKGCLDCAKAVLYP